MFIRHQLHLHHLFPFSCFNLINCDFSESRSPKISSLSKFLKRGRGVLSPGIRFLNTRTRAVRPQTGITRIVKSFQLIGKELFEMERKVGVWRRDDGIFAWYIYLKCLEKGRCFRNCCGIIFHRWPCFDTGICACICEHTWLFFSRCQNYISLSDQMLIWFFETQIGNKNPLQIEVKALKCIMKCNFVDGLIKKSIK